MAHRGAAAVAEARSADYFHIKVGLRKFFRADLTEERRARAEEVFTEFAFRMSELAVVASRAVHFNFYKILENDVDPFEFDEFVGINYFDQYFMAQTQNKYGLCGDLDFFELREQVAPTLSVCSNNVTGSGISVISQLFCTNFANTTWMNAKKRIVKLIKVVHRDVIKEELEVIIDLLFNRESECILTPETQRKIDTVVRIMQPPDGNFHHCNRVHWFRYIKPFWLLQRYFEAHRVENFKLIPQFRHGQMSIQIDSKTLATLLNHMWPGTIRLEERTVAHKPYIWSRIFNYEQFTHRNVGKRFNFSMHCNGVVASLKMRKPKIPAARQRRDELESLRTHEANMRRKLDAREYDVVGGIDLGVRVFAAVNFVDMRTSIESNVKLSSNQFRSNCGELYFKRKRNEFYQAEGSAVRMKEEARPNFAFNPDVAARPGYTLMQNMLDNEVLQRQIVRNEREDGRAARRVAQRAASVLHSMLNVQPLDCLLCLNHHRRHRHPISATQSNCRQCHTISSTITHLSCNMRKMYKCKKVMFCWPVSNSNKKS